jgi:formylglycine-generating enzyme required for sulfatase activity
MVTTTASLGIGSTKVSPKDRKVLVFVPEGEFLMGSPEGEGKPDEHPQHTVLLDAYWIDKFEVTNDEYNQCLLAGKCTEPKPTGGNKNPHPLDLPSIASNPVVGVDWNQSKTYCEWAGRRLPTEAEWEKAARGTNSRIYPWGNISPTNIFLNYGNKISKTTKVGSYPEGVSPYGALDMAGNVWEWTSDLYDERFYWGVDYVPPTCSPNGTIKWQDEDGTWKESSYPGWCDTANYGTKSVEAKFINPVGPLPDQGYVSHVLRGGSYRDQAFVVRSASRTRNLPTFTSSEIGFRCAVSQ